MTLTEHSSSEDDMRARILQEIDDTEWHYHWFPHMGLIPDWQVRYRDLAKLVKQYFCLQ